MDYCGFQYLFNVACLAGDTSEPIWTSATPNYELVVDTDAQASAFLTAGVLDEEYARSKHPQDVHSRHWARGTTSYHGDCVDFVRFGYVRDFTLWMKRAFDEISCRYCALPG